MWDPSTIDLVNFFQLCSLCKLGLTNAAYAGFKFNAQLSSVFLKSYS
jgi:hypothetical protein